MEYIPVIFIAIALSMDAFAVSIVSGSVYKHLKIRHIFRMAAFFGAFQAIMPLIGALTGATIKQYIEGYDHWVAFGILSVIGGKMLYESFKIKSTENNFDPANLAVLFILAVATSIDALAVGITLSLLKISIFITVAIIGVITFCLSYAGVYVGRVFGHFFENKIKAAGGGVLIAIGLKILLEHIYYN